MVGVVTYHSHDITVTVCSRLGYSKICGGLSLSPLTFQFWAMVPHPTTATPFGLGVNVASNVVRLLLDKLSESLRCFWAPNLDPFSCIWMPTCMAY